jgi:hypothetical protein
VGAFSALLVIAAALLRLRHRGLRAL